MNPDTNVLRDESHETGSWRTSRIAAIGLGLAGPIGVYALARARGGHPGGLEHALFCLMITYFLAGLAIVSMRSCMRLCEGDRCRLLCWRTYLFEMVLIWLVEWFCLLH